jgi:hypothetical protein
MKPDAEAFRKRMETELEWCHELFKYATIRLLALKYAYYVESRTIVEDVTYDGEEAGWFMMGSCLGLLKEDETSPCIDFDPKHPYADEAIALAKTLKEKKTI